MTTDKKRIMELEKRIVELESRLTPKKLRVCDLKPTEKFLLQSELLKSISDSALGVGRAVNVKWSIAFHRLAVDADY